jgi:hypothetical protein
MYINQDLQLHCLYVHSEHRLKQICHRIVTLHKIRMKQMSNGVNE